jgi:hypothetical protein
VRGWIDGLPLHIAKPHGERRLLPLGQGELAQAPSRGHLPQRSRQGAELAARTRRARLSHRLPACDAVLRGGPVSFRIAAYEDLRHLLKHKRRYAPDALTAAERRVLAKKSLFTRVWMATGKKLYYWITRDLLASADREGGGTRLVHDAPRIVAPLKAHPQVREAWWSAFPDRRAGTGLYAFVEGRLSALTERGLREFLATETAEKAPPKLPEHLQVTERLPRTASGEVRREILELVAMNQVDLIEPLIANEDERGLVAHIVADRRKPARSIRLLGSAEDAARRPGRAPNAQLPPPRRNLDRRNGS